MFLNPFVLREILKQQSYVSIQDWKVACLISMRNFGILPFSLAILSLVCFTCMNSSLVAALDMITEDQQIGDGETLDSVDESFVLGFFSPPNSTNRYVGIWYKKVPVKTIIWVANRERPLKDNTGILTINDGNLVIMDSRGGFITISFGSSSSSNTTAQLLESGNLVLRENNGRVLWQSFDYPTDAFLPGMKLGRNIKNKQNRLLTAWRSEEDPAVGIYSFGADPNGTRQFFIWQDETIYWSSGIFTRNTFSLVPPSGFRNLFNYSYVSNDDEQYFTYSLVNKSLLSRFVLQPSGQVQQLTWSEESQKFNLYWSHPRDRCDVYAPCGAFGSCSTNRSSLCKCLQGFEPVQPTDWDSNNWSDGCRRQTRLTCGVGDAFLKLRSTKYPDQLRYVEDSSQDPRKCEIMCISNCSCIAYASVNKTGCLFWSGNLMGLRENYNEAGQAYGKQILFVRVAASDLDEGNSTSHDQGQKKRVWVIVVVTAALVSFLVVFFALYFWRKLQKQRGDEKRRRELFNKDDKGSDLQLFSFATIVAATENFSPANKLGQGGFGPVYKGKSPDGQEIAVKRLSKSSGQGLKEFKNEIELIAKLQHMNLVRLLGCCIQVEEKMLIYEYMPNKSLDSFLFDPAKGTKLDWGRRVHIIEGIAQGLLYLHKYSRLKVIHRDLKASNILLDGEMNPKISDFGMARMFGNNAAEANTNRIVGTYGYMSPEYAMRGIFSVKSDVFSFGVLLLEIISGQKNSSFDPLDGSLSFLGYVWELWKDGKGAELMDSVLSPSSSPTDEVVRYVNIALLCVQEKAKDRPTMVEVVSMLSSEAATLPIPNQPAFFLTRHDVGLDSTTKSSANGLTISMVDAR